MTPQSRIAAVDPAAREGPRPSAAAVGIVCAGSVCATTATLAKSGGNCASVMTSTACTTRGSSAQVRTHELK